MTFGKISFSGKLKTKVLRRVQKAPWQWHVKNRCRWGFIHGWGGYTVAKSLSKVFGLTTVTSRLSLQVNKSDGQVIDYGVVGYRLVTDAGVDFIVDALQALATINNMRYHGIGTGSTAEAVGDTALVTELTTEYNPDNTRATGTQTEGASSNIYQTVGTNTVDAAVALREHGILDQAAVGGGTLLDRTVYALINLSNGDSLQSTYDFTVNSGG